MKIYIFIIAFVFLSFTKIISQVGGTLNSPIVRDLFLNGDSYVKFYTFGLNYGPFILPTFNFATVEGENHFYGVRGDQSGNLTEPVELVGDDRDESKAVDLDSFVLLPLNTKEYQFSLFKTHTAVVASTDLSAFINVIELATGIVKAAVEVTSAYNLTESPLNVTIGASDPTGSSHLAIGVVDGQNYITKFNILTLEITQIPIPGPIGFNFVYVILDQPTSGSIYKNNSVTSSPAKIFYSANDGIHGLELWITDGSAAGTHMVKDISLTGGFGGPSHSYPSQFTPMNNKLYFFAASDAENSELWVSDGTELGTTMVKSINPGSGNSNISDMVNINNMLYFSANNGTDGNELWKSDGIVDGTTEMIKDIYPGTDQWGFPRASSPSGFTLFNGLIYFSANDGIHGGELWVTDGTESETKMVKNINNTGDGSTGSSPILPGLVKGGVFYFYANDGIHGYELWVSDGTQEGTQLAYDLFPGPDDSIVTANWGKIAGDNLYVSATDGVIGAELFIFEDIPTTVPIASLSLKVFLEGSYVSNSMSTNLTSSIPLSQPFNNAAGNYYGDETIDAAFAATHNIVDWVKVELRTGASASEATTIVAQKAVLINGDGNLVDLDGGLDIDFKWVEAGDYYVTVYHRNHLKVMSSQVVTLTNL